jgi:hypothetical protein
MHKSGPHEVIGSTSARSEAFSVGFLRSLRVRSLLPEKIRRLRSEGLRSAAARSPQEALIGKALYTASRYWSSGAACAAAVWILGVGFVDTSTAASAATRSSLGTRRETCIAVEPYGGTYLGAGLLLGSGRGWRAKRPSVTLQWSMMECACRRQPPDDGSPAGSAG